MALSGCAFDFSGARIIGCRFDGALIEGARFDQAETDQAGFDPAKRTSLRHAKDWDQYSKVWQRAVRLQSDDHLAPLSVFQDAPFAPEMVVSPPGYFVMGESEEEHKKFNDSRVDGVNEREVGIPPLAVGRFAVTRGEWREFVRDGGRDAFGAHDGARGRWKFGAKAAHEARGAWSEEDLAVSNMPAVQLSWHDAKAYVAWLSAKTGKSYRLLHFAEWEYVARAGTTTRYWWGDTISSGLANYNPDYRDPTTMSDEDVTALINRRDRRGVAAVEQYLPNPWGLYQVHGNVGEWCEGWAIQEDQTRDKDNPNFSIDPAMMVAPVRGGACSLGGAHCRSAALYMALGLQINGIFGVRVARELDM